MDGARASRLAKLFSDILYDKTKISPANYKLFLEALRSQPEVVDSLYKLENSPKGKDALQNSFFYTLDNTFLNDHAAPVIRYLQHEDLPKINGGKLLQGILLKIVDPPIFWSEFRKAFMQNALNLEAQEAFGWLLLQLVSLPPDSSAIYRNHSDFPSINAQLLSSDEYSLRTLGQKVKHAMATESAGGTAGGRHDNDFPDFRSISIVPTPDEVLSTEASFIRPSSVLHDPATESSRVAIHLDNQFRLLREDMMYKLREELQVVFGKRKQRHQGRPSTRIAGLTAISLYLEQPPPPDRPYGKPRPTKCGLQLQCRKDLPLFDGVTEGRRLKHITDDKDTLKHQSLACLLAEDEIIAFVTINRDLTLLAREPPIIVVQLEGNDSSLKSTLGKIKACDNLTLIPMNTAIFAYEFVLKALQKTMSLALSEELLFWKAGNSPRELDPSQQALQVVNALRLDPGCDLKPLLATKEHIHLDKSQSESLLAGLVQRVSLIQGPHDTGKSFLGALMAKAIHDYTEQSILVVCSTNHALDDILTSLLEIGIPESSMVRLGGKSTARTEPLSLRNQSQEYSYDSESIDDVTAVLDHLYYTLTSTFDDYMARGTSLGGVLEHLESEDPAFFDAFTIPEQEDDMEVIGSRGYSVDEEYLLERWLKGQDAGVFSFSRNVLFASDIWAMNSAGRKAKKQGWYDTLESNRLNTLYDAMKEYNKEHTRLGELFSAKDISILQGKRVIGCTTSAAAKFEFILRAVAPDVVLVEEAGEILESHILTSLNPNLSQLILIGDPNQPRPKANNYELAVEKGNGYDFNCSLFERLILSGYPYQTLSKQHRMRPEISDPIRQLTYPDLLDALRTQGRPDIRGLQDNIVFIEHASPEGALDQIAEQKDMGSTTSKFNVFEVGMVLKIVRYLGQQGYGTNDLVILTPYHGQLVCLREALVEDNDPVLNDLDSYELVRAGLLTPAAAEENKKPIRLATIDNYQGEESDIVIISLTRSNPNNDIGFMYSPERLNVLLSRARNGLIMIGNSNTFKKSRKGGEIWKKLFGMLSQGKHIYDGLPVFCERHPDCKAVLKQVEDFDEKFPFGGCQALCDAILNCGIHKCTLTCHNIMDHSKVRCEAQIEEKCEQGHALDRRCHEQPKLVCKTCEREAKRAKDKALADRKEKLRRHAAEQRHLKELAEIDAEIEKEQWSKKEAKEKQDRERIVQLRLEDLVAFRADVDLSVGSMSTPQVGLGTGPPAPQGSKAPLANIVFSKISGLGVGLYTSANYTAKGRQWPLPAHTPPTNSTNNRPPFEASTQFTKKAPSPAVAEWLRQKSFEGAFSSPIDEIMAMVGLEEVKKQVLAIKAKIDTVKRQNSSLAKERFNISFLGNPGTGKTTIARRYSTFLSSVGVVPGNEFVETTGSKLGYEGVQGAEKMLKSVLAAGGGSIFIDEAHRLTNGNDPSGAQVLDYLLAEMENNVGKIVFILAGYNKEMETFFEHNPGLPSRVPYKLKFDDYSDEELMEMFENLIINTFKYEMQVEDGYRGLYSRIAIRRLGRRREASGFGNARDLQVFFAQVRERQAIRLNEEWRDGKQPDDFFLAREDLIGPDPSVTVTKSKAWQKLQDMIGLKSVKESVSNIVDSIQENYERELSELKPLAFSLNRVFLGSPGTGKTTVASLYGQILADLGLLSKGEVVVKNPSDFTGAVLGESEKNTKGILSNSVGKVLVIDEAYMLYGGGGDDAKNQSNQFKTSVIDTIVAEVQNVPGDDRCVLLLGYEKQMIEMFNNVNPGLARRFKVEEAFKFEDFNDAELLKILEKKMKEQEIGATDPAKKVAIELLSRARTRPNFGNGGEVENLLSKAKEQCLARRPKIPLQQRPKYIIFEPQDLDNDFDLPLPRHNPRVQQRLAMCKGTSEILVSPT